MLEKSGAISMLMREKAFLKELHSGIKAPDQTILMAVGWLGREGYILMEGDLPDPLLKLSLCQPLKN